MCFHGPDKQGVFCEILYLHFILCAVLNMKRVLIFNYLFFYESFPSGFKTKLYTFKLGMLISVIFPNR